MTEASLLTVDNVATHFRTERGTVRAVDGISFELRRGEALGIVGESGSGKTVLSRTIMGLLPATATHQGSVKYEGRELLGQAAKVREQLWGREMSMIFQNPMVSLNPVMKIGAQLAEPIRQHLGLSKSAAKDRAVQLLSEVRIPEPKKRLNQYPHQLSGGMRQRVMIAIALAANPTLLFADEPTTALDVTVQKQILDLIRERQAERDMAMVLVTHDLGVVAGYTDHIMVMYGGLMMEKAPTKTLFEQMRHPYTKSLLRSIPSIENPSHTRLQTIAGRPPDLVAPPPGCRFASRCLYARAKCHTDRPPTVSTNHSEHLYACWYPVGSPEFNARDAEITANFDRANSDRATSGMADPLPSGTKGGS